MSAVRDANKKLPVLSLNGRAGWGLCNEVARLLGLEGAFRRVNRRGR